METLVARATRDFVTRWEATEPADVVGPVGRAGRGGRVRSPSRAVRRERRARERATQRLADRLEAELRAFPGPNDLHARASWRSRVRAHLFVHAGGPHGLPPAELAALVDDELLVCTRAFVRAARAFAPAVALEDVFQALRNAWIMNNLQRLVGAPVELTPSVFSYSMLYPWTDNRLDDARLTAHAKRRSAAWLARRLAGHALPGDVLPGDSRRGDSRRGDSLRGGARDRREAAGARTAEEREERTWRLEVDRLVAGIERQYPRGAWPDVWASVRAIHAAQLRSLDAQGGARPQTEREVLAISVPKGGASVLADGFLVAGTLDVHEQRALFDYGAVLQLLDDLQDVEADRAAGHWTVFSRLAGRVPLDAPAARLRARMDAVLDEVAARARVHVPGMPALVRRSCEALFLQAVAERPGLFSKRFVAELEAGSRLRFAFLRRFRRRTTTRTTRALRALRRAGRLDSELDLLG